MEHPEFKKDEPLARHTSFAIGGPAKLFIEVSDSTSLKAVLRWVDRTQTKFFVLGGGTNLLVSDSGYDGLIIKLNIQDMGVNPVQNTVRVGAGMPTAKLVERLIQSGFGGLQFAAGLPGTVGGAIAGNAGCFGHTLSDFLVETVTVDETGDEQHIRDKTWFCFDYRYSALHAKRSIVSELVFRVHPEDKTRLREEADRYLAVRTEKHPPRNVRTAGSYFKNLPPETPGERRRAAGALLDQVGARGMSQGDAAVFEHHANIIINRGNARAEDVLRLAAAMKRRVRDRFGVQLTEEVRFLGQKPILE